jgi:hypothetical protein
MANRKPEYRVCVAEKNGSESFFTDVGAGWSFSSEKAAGISIKLRANIAVSGELVLFESREDT